MSKLTASREAEITARLLKHWHEALPRDRMAHLVKDVARSFLRSLQARLAEHGVTLGHWTFLRILWERDGLTQRELSQEAGLMEPTTAAALRGMERLGYITRRRLDGNRKNIYIYLTPAARALKKILVPLAEDVNGLALRELNDGDVETTRRTLLVMLDNLAGDAKLGAAESGAAAA
ncbi:MAG: hypothetical protein NVS3B2_02570 [Ramlibacter sp.]